MIRDTKGLRPALAITMGDPAGVGPEIVAEALGEEDPACRVVVIGSHEVFEEAQRLRGTRLAVHEIEAAEIGAHGEGAMFLEVEAAGFDPKHLAKGRTDASTGEAAYAYILRACELARNGTVEGIVTAPVNKEAINRSGREFSGHTEMIARELGATSFAMMQHSPELTVAFVTTHLSLAKAAQSVTAKRIVEVCRLADGFLRKIGAKRRRLAVCGLNPHAGEGGYMGEEEGTIIREAIEKGRSEGLDIEGPFPSDTMFVAEVRNGYDVAIAMYHDQGHIPFKMLAFDHGVNVTLGLSKVRTSVDHGTATDIAWKGLAKASSMKAALALASRLVRK